ncbi:MAG: heptaprenyl diphosphate synthase component 1, partial [Bhargavaea sp.]
VHYRILAEMEDIHLIRGPSASVTEMSERKIRLYEHREGDSPEPLLSYIETIESGTVSAFLMERGYGQYEAAARHGLTACRLHGESRILREGGRTPFLNAFLRSEGISGNPAEAARVLDRCRQFHAGRLIEETATFGNRTGDLVPAIAGIYRITEPASIQTGKKD